MKLITEHVWNLGFAPLAGIRVEFYWFDPSLGIDGSHANLIGMARCELAGRGMAGSHKLVKCPVAWPPIVANGGHECLVVRASGIGDPIGANEWAPRKNRHVCQRNISVVTAGTDVSQLIAHLERSRFDNARIQFVQLSAREGELARHLVTPKLRAADLATHVLGEIALDGSVRLGMLKDVPAAMLASIHPLAEGGPPPTPRLRPIDKTRIFDPKVALGSFRKSAKDERGQTSRRRTTDSAHLHDLLAGIRALHAGTAVHDAPKKGEAQVVPIASYQGDQLIGGYTMVVTA